MSTTITIDSNIVAAPSLKFTPGGYAVATFTVAVSNRQKKAGEWIDAAATYHDIEAWTRVTITLHIANATELSQRNGETRRA